MRFLRRNEIFLKKGLILLQKNAIMCICVNQNGEQEV